MYTANGAEERLQLKVSIMCWFIYTAQKHRDERYVWRSFDVKPASETSPGQTFLQTNVFLYFQEIHIAIL